MGFLAPVIFGLKTKMQVAGKHDHPTIAPSGILNKAG